MSAGAPRDRVVLVTEGSDAAPLAWLREQVRVIEISPDDPRFDENLKIADGMAVRTYTRVDDAMLARAPRLKVVGRGGVGLENIDVNACRKRGVEVVYTPDANTLAVGDFVFGYMLQLLRPWAPFKDKVYDSKEFKRIRNTVRGRQLNELTIGILGMGRVGRRVGDIAAKGFGMRVLYNDILDIRPESLSFAATSVDKDMLYRESDVLSIHVTMLPGNENLVGRAQLALLKPSAIVINTSRGEVLDVAALAEALRAGKVAGAALDVFYPEPPGPEFPLLGFDNVILTPHLAARTYTALENMSWVVRDLVGVLDGRKPRHPAP
jgi:phosphoglycerate dehydrogenase-like enzyme